MGKEKEGQLLNLDDLLPEKHEFVYRGKTYELAPLTVKQYLQLRDLDLKAGTDELSDESWAATSKFLAALISGLSEEDLNNLPLICLPELISLINEFVTSTVEEEEPKGKKS